MNLMEKYLTKMKSEAEKPEEEILPETSLSLAEKYSGMSLNEFEKADTVLKIYSKILNETVYFASNESAIKKCGTLAGPVYSAEELRQLIRSGIGKKDIKEINESKKVFGGKIQ